MKILLDGIELDIKTVKATTDPDFIRIEYVEPIEDGGRTVMITNEDGTTTEYVTPTERRLSRDVLKAKFNKENPDYAI